MLHEAFEELTSVSIWSHDESVHVKRFAFGGQRSGMVSITWWRLGGFLLIIDRWAALTGQVNPK